jgi:AraC-like DNA-binding protein
LEIRKLAQRAFMSEDHFIRIFRREMGETPNAYIIRLKMERAELLLVTTQLPVKCIADMVGYDEVPYFVRLFKKKVGKTPKEYRLGKTK